MAETRGGLRRLADVADDQAIYLWRAGTKARFAAHRAAGIFSDREGLADPDVAGIAR